MMKLLALLFLAVAAPPAFAVDAARVVETAGRLHLPILHFPLVLLIVAAGVALRGRHDSTVGVLVRLGAVASVGTALTGLLLAEADPAPAVVVHRNAGLLTVAVAVLASVAWRRLAFSRSIVCAAGLVAAVTGHLGGAAAHGDGWLWRSTSGAPPVTLPGPDGPAADVGDSARPTAAPPRERHPEGTVVDKPGYVAHIKPIFERSCLKCHGPEKRKGGLRLDQKRYAMKGGESGPTAIVPGNAAASIVFMSCSAAPDDDDVMPPRGKLLALSEVETIKRWLDQGADWPEPMTP